MTNNIMKEEETKMLSNVKFEEIGMEDFENDKVDIGFLKCVQKSSTESEIDGVSPGDFFNTVTGESYGPSASIIIVKKDRQWVKFPGDNSEEKTLWSANGEHWDNGEKLTREEKWKCEQYRFYVLIKNAIDPIPVRLILKSTSRKTGSRISSMIKRFILLNKEPIFYRSFKLTSEKKIDKKNSFYIITESLNEGFNSVEEQGLSFDARKVAQAHALRFSGDEESEEYEEINTEENSSDLGLDN